MRILRGFDGGRQIGEFGSAEASVVGVTRDGHVVVISIGPGGLVGRHPAGADQLFLVVSGSGWVSGPDGQRVALRAGEAVVWSAGEEHESGSDEGLTALVVEAEQLDV
jgi:quercetin dioxygenase-like cupin family protein